MGLSHVFRSAHEAKLAPHGFGAIISQSLGLFQHQPPRTTETLFVSIFRFVCREPPDLYKAAISCVCYNIGMTFCSRTE